MSRSITVTVLRRVVADPEAGVDPMADAPQRDELDRRRLVAACDGAGRPAFVSTSGVGPETAFVEPVEVRRRHDDAERVARVDRADAVGLRGRVRGPTTHEPPLRVAALPLVGERADAAGPGAVGRRAPRRPSGVPEIVGLAVFTGAFADETTSVGLRGRRGVAVRVRGRHLHTQRLVDVSRRDRVGLRRRAGDRVAVGAGESHCCHWYANLVGEFVHLPLPAVSVLPSGA